MLAFPLTMSILNNRSHMITHMVNSQKVGDEKLGILEKKFKKSAHWSN